MIFKQFGAHLCAPLGKDDHDLPLAPADLGRLLALLPADETMPLVVRDGVNAEELLIANQCGQAYIAERGEPPRRFPAGSCVGFEITLAVVRHEICHHECCPEPGEPPLRPEIRDWPHSAEP